MRRHLIIAAVALLAGLAACEKKAPVGPIEPLLALSLDDKLVADARLRAATTLLRKENRERGWKCGYQEAWTAALFDAREKAPLRWRGSAVGGALIAGLVLFGFGLGGTLLMALLVPRLRRRRAERAMAAQARTGWLAFLAEGLRRLLRALGRALRVDYFDRAIARARVDAIHECMETERLLAAADRSVDALPAEEGAPEPAEVGAAIDAWADDVRALRRRLEDNGFLGPRLNPVELLPTLIKGTKSARRLRVELARAELVAARDGAPADAAWQGWHHLAESHPRLPVDRALEAKSKHLEPWVRPVGWAGVAALALAVPMAAAWTAAGAFPLFFALLFALGGLGAVLTARVYLFQAGRLPLLPGLADRLGSALTWLALAMTVLLVASSMASSASGLDLGDPPPVETPGAAEMQPPPVPPLIPAEVPK